MPNWAAFAGLTAAVLLSLLALARASQSAVVEGNADSVADGPDGTPPDDASADGAASDESTPDADRRDRNRDHDHDHDHGPNSSTDESPADGGPASGPDEGVEPRSDADPAPDAGSRGAGAAPRTGTGTGAPADTNANADSDAPPTAGEPWAPAPSDGSDAVDGTSPAPTDERDPASASVPGSGPVSEMTTAQLLVNVALSQGLLGVVLLGGAWYTRIPPAALGVDLGDPLSTGVPALAVGVALGTALFLLSAAGAAGAAAFGIEHDETLREMLLPDAPAGWALLLGAVLPVIAGFEELLFRAAVIGATSAGFPVSPWLLAVGSSVAFAFGHGAQGRAGIVVTGSLGFVLAGAFVLTNSLLAVVVAHYLVNALEFVLGGYFGIEWG